MTQRTRWIWILLVAAVVGALGWRGWAERQAAPEPAQTAPANDPVIELSALDVEVARIREIGMGVPVSGTLNAVNSAIVKARVSGELQGLSVREGDTVKAGQIIARVESSDYAYRVRQAEQQADAAHAQVDIAQRQYDNNAALVKQGFISETALDTSQANLNAAKANHRAAMAATEVARKSVADTVLRAPISGQVSQRRAQPGERVSPEAPIVEIVDLSRLELEAALTPADSVAVRTGQSAELRVEGLTQPVAATVARINPSTQVGSRSVLVYLEVAPTPGLRQGLFAQGQLSTTRQSALSVPLSAVRTDKPLPYVQVLEDGRIAHQTVEMGARGAVEGETMVAVKGVADGAVVLRAAAGALREGTEARLADPVMAPSSPASVSASPSTADARP